MIAYIMTHVRTSTNMFNTSRVGSVMKRVFTSSQKRMMVFEGNIIGIESTPEERMKRVFGGRLKGEPPKSTSRVLFGGTRLIGGVMVPARPIEPDNCCMSGCANCVWEVFNDDIREWRGKRKEAASSITGTDEIWPKDWDPPLSWLDIENIPEKLKASKMQLEKAKKEKPDVASLFPKRKSPLPKSVVEAKERRLKLQQEKQDKIAEDEDEEGWNDVPVYIKAFAEFERNKRHIRREAKLRARAAAAAAATAIPTGSS